MTSAITWTLRLIGVGVLAFIVVYRFWLQHPADLGYLTERVAPAQNDFIARSAEARQRLAKRGLFCRDGHYVIVLTTFIPTRTVTVARRTFLGDDRQFDPYASSYRTRQVVVVAPNVQESGDPLVVAEESVGRTVEFDGQGHPARTAFASAVGFVRTSGSRSLNRWVEIVVESSDPLVMLAPTIDIRVRISISPDGKSLTWEVMDDGFPNFELVIFDGSGSVLAQISCDGVGRNPPEALFPFLMDHHHERETVSLVRRKTTGTGV